MTEQLPQEPIKRKRGRPRSDDPTWDREAYLKPKPTKVIKPSSKWQDNRKKYHRIKYAADGRITIDDNDVIALAQEDCTVTEIAAFLGTTPDNLYLNHSEALNIGRDKGTASLKRKAFSMAMGGDTKMLVFLLKNRTNYREQPVESVAEQAITILLNDVPQPERVKAIEKAIINQEQETNQREIDVKQTSRCKEN